MSYYELLVFGHIAAAIIWLGAGFLIGLLVLGAERAGDRMKEAGYHQDVGWLAPRLFIPASLATLVFGILLVADGAWTLDQLWIVIALCGWAVSFLLGILYFKPEGERIAAIAEERGPQDPEIAWRIPRLNVVDRLQLVILFTVVFDMVFKPTSDDGDVLVVGAIVLVAAMVLAFAAIRRQQAAAAGDQRTA